MAHMLEPSFPYLKAKIINYFLFVKNRNPALEHFIANPYIKAALLQQFPNPGWFRCAPSTRCCG